MSTRTILVAMAEALVVLVVAFTFCTWLEAQTTVPHPVTFYATEPVCHDKQLAFVIIRGKVEHYRQVWVCGL